MSGVASDVADALRTLAPGLLLEPLVEAAVIAGGLLPDGPVGAATVDPLGESMAGEGVTVLVGGRAGAQDAIVATAQGGEWKLSGRARVVPFAAEADHWFIAASDARTAMPVIFRAAREETTVLLNGFRLMDGQPAGDVVFESASLPASSKWLEGPNCSSA